MSLAVSFLRILKFALQNVARNAWLSLVTLSIFILTLVTVNAVLFLNVLAQMALVSIEQKVEVTIYFEPDASSEIVQAAQGYLLALPQVVDVSFLTAEQALEAFKLRHADDASILASLEEIEGNPFGHSLVVRARDTDDFAFILEAIETPEFSGFIKEKDYTDYENIIERLEMLDRRVRLGGVVLAGFFIVIAVLIVFNTIRVAIYVHREEIGIMKLVGANDWFVRAPFLVEAMFYSMLATLLVTLLVLFALQLSSQHVTSYFGDIDVNPLQFFWENGLLIFGTQLVGLSMLSLLTTWYAMRKFLRV